MAIPGPRKTPGSSYDNWHNREKKPNITSEQINHHPVDLNYQAYVSGGPVTVEPPGRPGADGTERSRGRRRPSLPLGPFVPGSVSRPGRTTSARIGPGLGAPVCQR